MKINVLMEPMNGKGFRVSSGAPLGITVEAPTREEALKKLQSEIQAKMESGAEVVSVEVGPDENPWLKMAGMYKDDPMIEDWKKAMAEYRDQREKDENYP